MFITQQRDGVPVGGRSFYNMHPERWWATPWVVVGFTTHVFTQEGNAGAPWMAEAFTTKEDEPLKKLYGLVFKIGPCKAKAIAIYVQEGDGLPTGWQRP